MPDAVTTEAQTTTTTADENESETTTFETELAKADAPAETPSTTTPPGEIAAKEGEGAPTTPAPAGEAPSAEEASKLAKAKAALQKHKAAARERQAAQQRSDQMSRALEQRDAELQQLRTKAELFEQYQRDPLGALEKAGLRAVDIAKRAVQQGSPEAQLEEMRRELHERTQRFEKALADQQRAEQRRAQEAEAAKQRAAFVADITAKAAKYPFLAKLAKGAPQQLVREAIAIGQEYFEKTGFHLTKKEAAQALEQRYAKTFGSPPQGSRESGDSTSQKTQGTAATHSKAGTQRTLTNDLHARGTVPKKLDELPEHEQNAIIAEQLRTGALPQ